MSGADGNTGESVGLSRPANICKGSLQSILRECYKLPCPYCGQMVGWGMRDFLWTYDEHSLSPACRVGEMGVEQRQGSRRPVSAPPELVAILADQIITHFGDLPYYGEKRKVAELIARDMASPVGDWIAEKFVEWAEQGLQTLPTSEYWNGVIGEALA